LPIVEPIVWQSKSRVAHCSSNQSITCRRAIPIKFASIRRALIHRDWV
jgi:hypothetical protein